MKNCELTKNDRKGSTAKKLFTGTLTVKGSIISIVVFFAVVAVMLLSHSSVELGDESFKASAVFVAPVEIAYDSVDSVTLLDRDELDLGEKTSGFSNFFTIAGSYINDEYGLYDVYLDKSNDANCILVNYQKVGYVVFSTGDPEETNSIYEELLLRV